MGEEIAAWLRLAPGREMSEQDVKSFLKGKVREGTLSTFDKKSIKPRIFMTETKVNYIVIKGLELNP